MGAGLHRGKPCRSNIPFPQRVYSISILLVSLLRNKRDADRSGVNELSTHRKVTLKWVSKEEKI